MTPEIKTAYDNAWSIENKPDDGSSLTYVGEYEGKGFVFDFYIDSQCRYWYATKYLQPDGTYKDAREYGTAKERHRTYESSKKR